MNDRIMAFSISMECIKARNKKDQILSFLKELRESDESITKIYLEGSCFKLFKILKSIYSEAKALYSTKDGHWITEINGYYYDINGRIAQEYVQEKNYETTNNTNETSASIHTYSNQMGTSYNKYEER